MEAAAQPTLKGIAWRPVLLCGFCRFRVNDPPGWPPHTLKAWRRDFCYRCNILLDNARYLRKVETDISEETLRLVEARYTADARAAPRSALRGLAELIIIR